MDGFEVDLDEVRSAAARRDAIAKTVNGLTASCTPHLGHAQLAQSGAAFIDRWDQGVRDLRDHV